MSAFAGVRGLALQAQLLTPESSAGDASLGCALLTVRVLVHIAAVVVQVMKLQ